MDRYDDTKHIRMLRGIVLLYTGVWRGGVAICLTGNIIMKMDRLGTGLRNAIRSL